MKDYVFIIQIHYLYRVMFLLNNIDTFIQLCVFIKQSYDYYL